MNELHRLSSVLRRTRLRLKLQLMLERATTMAVLAIALGVVALFFYKSRSLGFEGLLWVSGLGGALVVAGALWGLVTPLTARYVLKRLDLANHTHDALGSAFDFADRPSELKHGPQAELMAAQIRQAKTLLARVDHRPAARFRQPRDLPALAVVSLAFAAFLAMAIPVPTLRAAIPPPEKPLESILIDSDLYQEAVDNVQDVEDLAKHLKDQETLDFLKEYRELLDALKRGALTREQFEERYKALQKKHFQGIEEEAARQKQLSEQVQEVGKELAKSKLTKALGEALQKQDLDKAREELRQLAEKMNQGKLTPMQKREVAKAMERAAKALGDRDARQLEESMRQEEKRIQQEIQQAESQLERMKRRLAQEKDSQNKRAMKRQFHKQQRQLEQLKRQQKRAAEQRRTLERLSRSMQEAASQLSRETMDEKTQAAMEELMKELSKYQNQAGRGEARGQSKVTLEQLKELLKRLRSQRGQQKGALSDYLDRARKGQQGHQGCSKCGGKGHQPGGKTPCPSCGGSGSMGGVGLGQGPGGRQGGLSRGPQGGKEGDQDGSGGQGGKKWGTGHNPDSVQGRPTDLGAKHEEHKAEAKQGEGPSEAQVFQGGAEKGFSSQSYRRVYVQYRKIWQEVLNQEEIPPGYRYLVERYFRLIKPR